MNECTPVSKGNVRKGFVMKVPAIGRGPVFAAALILTAGFVLDCASTKQTRRDLPPAQVESMLVAAGFQKNLADTPEKMEKIQGLTQRVVAPHLEGGKVYYVYADAAGCRCVYVGDELDFERFSEMLGRAETVNPYCIDERLRGTSNWSSWGNLNSLCN